MGVSTDAVVFFGYCWDDEFELPETATELWKGDVLVGRHGSDGWTVPYVYVEASRVSAARGYPQNLTAAMFAVQLGWPEALDAFCADHNIVPPQESPQWWLVSWWG